MIKDYKIIDILHSGNKAPEGTRKIGEKYDKRRGQTFFIDDRDLIPGHCLIFEHLLITTPFEKSWSDDKYFYIKTFNSIYVCEEIK